MTDSVQQVWVIPPDIADMAPLPALLQNGHLSLYCRRKKEFEPIEWAYSSHYLNFEECRIAMMAARTQALDETREHARMLASSIEHIRSLPVAAFPDVLREVPEAQQQEVQAEEEAEAEKVKPMLKRPSRKSNA